MKFPETFEVKDPLSKIGKVEAGFGDEPVCALMQGYPFTTFALVRGGHFLLPAELRGKGDWNDLFDLRLFNKNAELHAWKTGNGKWQGRIRADDTGQETSLVLWGTKEEQAADEHFTCLVEDRGVRFWAPTSEVVGKKLPLKLKAREYLEPDEVTGLVQVVDYRLCGFE
jgi:CRISPR-associated protein (TIGR03984 family)